MSGRTVFVVDDVGSVRRALDRLLRSVGYAVRSFPSGESFLHEPTPSRPGCLVLDVRMSGLSGLDLQKTISGTDHDVPVIFITGHGDIPMSVRAMRAGAVDFLPKPFHDEDLLASIERAIARDEERRARQFRREQLEARLATLTPREREVFRHVASGQLNKQIAADLGISEKTIKVHRGRVMKKMSARSLADLVRMAGHLGY